MSLSPSAIESLEKHDFGWKDLRCETPGCQAPADGSFQDHYYCQKHLREELSRRSQDEREKGYPPQCPLHLGNPYPYSLSGRYLPGTMVPGTSHP